MHFPCIANNTYILKKSLQGFYRYFVPAYCHHKRLVKKLILYKNNCHFKSLCLSANC